MIICNYGDNAFDRMKDHHYWFLVEPTSNSVCFDGIPDTNAKIYIRFGIDHCTKEPVSKKTLFQRILDFVKHAFSPSNVELLDCKVAWIECMDIMDNRVPEWIIKHFEKFKTLPGTFYFYEFDDELYLSLRPVNIDEDDIPYLTPCTYDAYKAIADTFSLNMPHAIDGKDCPWIFNRLGETFVDSTDLRRWREIAYMETGNLVFLAKV